MRSPRRDQGRIALEVTAAVMAVVVVALAILGGGVPEKVACGIEGAVTSVLSAPGPDDDCAVEQASAETSDGGTSDGGTSDDAGATTVSGELGGGVRLDSSGTRNGGVALIDQARGIRDVTAVNDLVRRASAPGWRCLPSLDGETASLLCVFHIDGGVEYEDMDRCVAGVGPDRLVCASPSADAHATLRTGHDTTAWCQPMRLNHGEDRPRGAASIAVQWACAGFGGDVHFCDSDVPVAVIGAQSAGGPNRDTYELLGWTDNPRYWPAQCDSRTLNDRSYLGCPPNDVDSHVGCAVPAYENTPPRPVTCLEFVGDTSTRPSHLINKPLHCVVGAGTCPTDAGPADPPLIPLIGGGTCVVGPRDLTAAATGSCAQDQAARRRASGSAFLRTSVAGQPPGALLQVTIPGTMTVPILIRTSSSLTIPVGEECTAAQREARITIGRIQGIIDGISLPEGRRGPLPPLPPIVLNDAGAMALWTSKTYVAVGRPLNAILVPRTLARSDLAWLHEYAHHLSVTWGTLQTGQVSWAHASLEEGFAHAFSWLADGGREGSVATGVLNTQERHITTLYRERITFDQISSRKDEHDNGRIVQNVMSNLDELCRDQRDARAGAPNTCNDRILRLLMSTVVKPRAMESFPAFRRALLASAGTAEIPQDLVELALIEQKWL